MADLHRTTRHSHLAGRDANRAMVRIFLTAFLTWCAGTMAAAAADLYRTKVTVTGLSSGAPPALRREWSQ